MNRVVNGLIIGGLVGMGSAALMNVDRRDMRRVQRRGKQLVNRAGNFVDDFKGFV